MHPNTQKKIKICSKRETLEALEEHIDISNIPKYYGGALDYKPPNEDCKDRGIDNCRFYSPEVLDLLKFVQDKRKAQQEEDSAMNDGSPSFKSPIAPL